MEKQVDEKSISEQGKIVAGQIQHALASQTVPKIYANGFTCARSNSDILVVLSLNGQPAGLLNLSFTGAKSLANDLRKTVADIERITSHTIMTINEVDAKNKKL